MKKKSILKGASFFLATFAFCGVMALGAKYISPRHEVNTTIETQVAYAEELATIDKTAWNEFKVEHDSDVKYNVTKLVVYTGMGTDMTSFTEIGDNVYAKIEGEELWICSTLPGEIYLPSDSSYMFSSMFGLTTIDLSNFNTQNVTNMSYMFFESYLPNIDVSGFNTSNVENMKGMFRSCMSITTLEISNFNTQNVRDMSEMFSGCSSLINLDLSNFDTANVTDMSFLFQYDYSLANINLTDFDTLQVSDMRNMFESCSSLRSLDLTTWDTSSVKDMQYMFSGCNALSNLDILNFDTSNVSYMIQMFADCSSLTELDLSSFDMKNVTSAENMFYGCDHLTGIYLPKVLPLTTVDLPTTLYLQNDKSVFGATLNEFAGYESTTSQKNAIETQIAYAEELATLDKTLWDSFKHDNGETCYYNVTKIVTLTNETDTTGATQIGENAYARISGDTLSIFSTNSSKIILPADCSELFYTFNNVTTMDLSNFDITNVTNMGSMFSYCYALTSLDVSGFDTSNVTNMGSMFSYCFALTSLDVSGFDTTNVTNMSYMFDDCQVLTSLDLSGFNTSNVTDMSYMFCSCSSLTSLDVNGFDTSKVTDMSSMFNDCGQLYKLDISSFDLSNVTNASQVFTECNNLRKIYLPRVVSDSVNIDLPYTYHTQSWNYSGSYLNDFRYTLSDDNTKRYIVTDSVESQEAVIDGTEWNKFKNDYFNSDIKKIVTKKAYEQYSSMTSLGENVYAYINGDTCEIYTRLDTKILLPEDCAAFFMDLEYITEIDLSACDASEVTNMNAMFYGCRSLETINFGENFNTSKVTNMSAMFAECYNLQSADLTSFNTANVENMFQMFYMCSSLNDINLSNLVTTKTTNMSAMFYGCLNLDEIDLPELDTSAVTTIEVMFYGCNSLKVVDLSSFDLTNVNTNKLFDGCENLSMIYLPKALPQGYDVELGSDFVLASNHAVKGSTLNAFAGYESTAGQKNAIVKGGEVNVVVDTQFADVISTGEEIEYYYGDEIVVNGTTLIIGGVSVQVIPNEVEGYEITFAGWEGIENGVVVGDTITAILTKTPINYTITMIVNGQNNTRTYNIETNTFTLEEPEGGEEEEFVGWTWEGQEVPVKDLEILKGSIGDRTVKANFAPKIYTITINVDGEITTIDYTKGSEDIVIKDPSSSGLIFDGWVDENGNKVDENVIKSGSTGDRYFKATWKKSPMLKYVAIGVLAFVGVAVATEIIVGVLVKKKKK